MQHEESSQVMTKKCAHAKKLQILAKNSGMKTLAGSQILAAAGSPGLPPFLQDESRSCLNLRLADARDSRECPSLLSCSVLIYCDLCSGRQWVRVRKGCHIYI